MKTLVTHFSPDLDAICSVWLVKRFLPGFDSAQVTFVPAGETLYGKKADSDPDVVHVDTGYGIFDHHQHNKFTCASVLVYEFLKDKGYLKTKYHEALKRLTAQINEIDHFRQVFWPQAESDRYELLAEGIIDGFRLKYPRESGKIIELGFEMMDAVLLQLENKIWAQKVIEGEGIVFKSVWGKSLAIESTNDEAVSLAQKIGFQLVVRKDPRKGYVRIKSLPKDEIDLESVYDKLKVQDKQATWYLHPSHHMVLNGSTKNPQMKPSTMTLQEIIKLIKGIKLKV